MSSRRLKFAPDEDQSWRELAECKGIHTGVFYSDHPREQAAAKKICDACKVRKECREEAYKNLEDYGVWGGATRHERREDRREQRRIA